MAFNINVGILGHVDSGKTSLARALSDKVSTAGLDKHPQSLERGITIDLGFTSFQTLSPDPSDGHVQVTLVDCPGHASLIRTVMSSTQIIDGVLLVIDATKGIQAQTVECLVIAALATRNAVVVFNKVDLLGPSESSLQSRLGKLRKAIDKTKFKHCPIIPTSATANLGIEELKTSLVATVGHPSRVLDTPFVMAGDHCFPVKGRGTVITGTVLSGTLNVGETVSVPTHGIQACKVKSIQSFLESRPSCMGGDRVGINLSMINAKGFERGYVCQAGAIQRSRQCIIDVEKVKAFRETVKTRSQFHVTVGCSTVMATLHLFSTESTPSAAIAYSQDLRAEDCLDDEVDNGRPIFGLIDMAKAAHLPARCAVIGSRLDWDIASSSCRIAFSGRVIVSEVQPKSIKLYRWKSRKGVLERIESPTNGIVRGLFGKNYPTQEFIGTEILLRCGNEPPLPALLESAFGKSGKMRVSLGTGPTQVLGSTYLGCSAELRYKKFTAPIYFWPAFSAVISGVFAHAQASWKACNSIPHLLISRPLASKQASNSSCLQVLCPSPIFVPGTLGEELMAAVGLSGSPRFGPRKAESPDGVEEMVDFTCVTVWERLTHSIESQLRVWLQEDADATRGVEKLEGPRVSTVSTDAQVYRIEWRRRSAKGLKAAAGDSSVDIDEEKVLEEEDATAGLNSGALGRFFGIHDCIYLGPLKRDQVIAANRHEAASLVGALSNAAVQAGCTLSLVVPVGQIDELRYTGRRVPSSDTLIQYDCDHVNRLPENLSHLAGLLELFQMKRLSVVERTAIQDLIVTAKFTFVWSEFSSRDPVAEIQLIASWPRFRVRELGRDPIAWALPPLACEKWLIRAKFNDQPGRYYVISKNFRLLVDLAREARRLPPPETTNIRRSFTDIESDQRNPTKSMRTLLARVADIASGSTERDTELIRQTLERVFGKRVDTAVTPNLDSAENEGLDDDDSATNFARRQDETIQSIPDLLSQFLYESGSVESFASLWALLMDGIGDEWNRKVLIRGVPLLNCCIERQNKSLSTAQREDAKASVASSRKQLAEGLISIATFDQLFEPVVQELPLLTKDMLERQNSQLESSSLTQPERARLQANSLFSDMQSFKAANPGCVMEDFVRWFSPADFIAGSLEDGRPTGHLSERMEAPGNLWKSLWEEADALPVERQELLFDAEFEGNAAIGFLRNLPVEEVIRQVALNYAAEGMSKLSADAKRICGESSPGNVSMSYLESAMGVGRAAVESALQSDPGEGLGRLTEAQEEIQESERTIHRAESMTRRLPHESLRGLVDSLLCGSTVELQDQNRRGHFADAAGLETLDERISRMLPIMREFVLEEGCVGPGPSDRMYARLLSDEFRVGLRLRRSLSDC